MVKSTMTGTAGTHARLQGMPFREAPQEGMFLLESSFKLIERICASRTETKKLRKEKMVVEFCVVDSSFQIVYTYFPKGSLAL